MIARWAGWLVVAPALAVHVWAVGSIVSHTERVAARQPAPLPTVLKLFNDGARRLGPGADFFALYHAGVQLERGHFPYDWTGEDVTPPHYAFRYLPALAEAMRPIVRAVRPWPAYLGWLAILEACLALLLFAVWRLFGGSAWTPWLTALCLAFTPEWLELQMGQFSFVMGMLVLAVGVLVREGRTDRAQVPWIASVFLKIYSLVFLPLWWRLGAWRQAAASVAILAGLNLVAFLAVPGSFQVFIEENLGHVRMPLDDAGNFGLPQVAMQVWVGVLHQSMESWNSAYHVLNVAILLFAAAIVMVRRVPPIPAMAMLLLAHQLSYMHVWEHHYSMLLPIGVLLLHDLRGTPAAAVTFAALLLLAIPTPFVFWDIPTTIGHRILLAGSKAFPALLLFGVATAACWVSRPAASGSSAPSPVPSTTG